MSPDPLAAHFQHVPATVTSSNFAATRAGCCVTPPAHAEHGAFRDAGRDEDFKAATDSKAAPPRDGLRLGLLALGCSSFSPAEPIQKNFAADEEPYD